jgi:hypothetical protein
MISQAPSQHSDGITEAIPIAIFIPEISNFTISLIYTLNMQTFIQVSGPANVFVKE